MDVKKYIILSQRGSKADIKPLALLLYLKHETGRLSCIRHCSINRISRLAHISPSTVRKYLPRLESMGFVCRQGRNNDVLVLRKICAKSRHRNFNLDGIDFSSFKSVYDSLRAMIFLIIQARKEHAKRMVRQTEHPSSLKDYKEARKYCNRCAHTDASGGFIYKENGISYRYISKVTGFCERTAQRIVKTAISLGLCLKKTNYRYYYMPGVCFREVEGFTFTTWDYGYIVGANTYTLTEKGGMLVGIN